MDPVTDRLTEIRLDEIMSLAHAGAWDGDPRATVLVQAIRDLLDERKASLAVVSQLQDALREVVEYVESQGFTNMPWLKEARAALAGVSPGSEDDRDPDCVARWPGCESGMYDPRCCRFPKSCSCSISPGSEEEI